MSQLKIIPYAVNDPLAQCPFCMNVAKTVYVHQTGDKRPAIRMCRRCGGISIIEGVRCPIRPDEYHILRNHPMADTFRKRYEEIVSKLIG